MSYSRSVGALLVVALLAAAGVWGWAKSGDRFPHSKHASLFSSCDGCHAIEADRVTFPDPSFCEGCHNGQVAPEVAWEGPSRQASKFAFNHVEAIAAKEAVGADASCSSCHLAPGGGAMEVRRAPATHTPVFAEEHRVLAATASADCQICHVRDQRCLGCHSGSPTLDTPAQDQASYHPENFLEQHAVAAWNQDVECASCHNPEAYCRSCHLELGRASQEGRTDTGFHNEDPRFQFGHGQAARQGLESCASCHAQSDCLACHSAKSGRNIKPHGPDFDAEKLRDKNPQLCLFCHFSSILDR
ncbi:MAG: hypothetical protein JSU87_14355 [Gemmatimonadota bacterium]|nr:MAG: hypothetical protein JSU87_14355 [Gemmatimonadota bacterium]